MPTESSGSSHKAPLILFILGLGVGVAGTLMLPGLVRPYLPTSLVGSGPVVSGIVTGKRVEPDRVLLTLPTPSGTVLATFTSDVEEIDLMIQQGDSVALEVDEYTPFVQNPKIARVVTLSSPLRNPTATPDSAATSPEATGPSQHTPDSAGARGANSAQMPSAGAEA